MTRRRIWGFILIPSVLFWTSACSHVREPTVPRTIPVPIPVPCEIEQVPKTELPVAEEGANVARKAQVAAARIELLTAENERLRAANNQPCPTEIPE